MDRCRAVILLSALVGVCAQVCGLAAPTLGSEVYKSVDAEGHVVYSDRADSTAAQKSVVHVDAPDPVEAARLAHEQALLRAEDLQRKRQQSADQQQAERKAQEQQIRCENARNHYYALKDARRIYDRDAEGNRIYYSDADGDAKREEARQAMLVACAN